MSTNTNYLVKVTDASMKDIRTALTEAGIEVRSILQVHKETFEAGEEQEASEGE